MIKFTQILTDDDYRNAGAANYGRSVLMKIRFYLALILVFGGSLLIFLGIFLLTDGNPLLIFMGAFFLLFGILHLFRKKLYMKKFMKAVQSGSNYGIEIRVRIDDDGMIEFRQQKDVNRSDLRNYHGYGITHGAILLYPQKNLFLILNKESIGDEWSSVLRKFDEVGLKRLF